MIRLDFQSVKNIDPSIDPEKMAGKAQEAQGILEGRGGEGSDFLGWLDLSERISEGEMQALEDTASSIQKTDALVVIGIGGSYLGTRAVLSALAKPFTSRALPVYFAGWQMDALYHEDLLSLLKSKKCFLNMISKSGSTLEPSLAFRFFWNDLKKRYSSKELQQLVVITTDSSKGSLRKFADSRGLSSFVIPDDIGGRFSVFTAVGLLPLAAAGIKIRKLLEGVAEMRAILKCTQFTENPALQYAAYRHASYGASKKIEILAVYQSCLSSFAEWWKQLFGESEGKNGRGIFPTSVNLSSDLHSLGQWIQEGERSVFETVLDIEKAGELEIPHEEKNEDNLNYLSGRKLHDVNRTALQAVLKAHQSGDVPCLRIVLGKLDEKNLGALMYFFMYSCAVSAYMLGVNPFDQPGVESYKKNMFLLLGKP